MTRLKTLQSLIGKELTSNPSQFGVWLHGTLLEASEGLLTMEFIVRKEMTNPVGMLHGGVIAGIFDEVIGIAFFTLGTENFYPTISLHVDFFHSAHMGETIKVTAKSIKKGNTIINIEAHMWNAEGKLLAKAGSNMAVSPIKIPY
ncbi:MAG: PaaI family thioesterase [Cytophagales bacterium]|nr:PaaI family thioesterase [Cytophagales bacterium]